LGLDVGGLGLRVHSLRFAVQAHSSSFIVPLCLFSSLLPAARSPACGWPNHIPLSSLLRHTLQVKHTTPNNPALNSKAPHPQQINPKPLIYNRPRPTPAYVCAVDRHWSAGRRLAAWIFLYSVFPHRRASKFRAQIHAAVRLGEIQLQNHFCHPSQQARGRLLHTWVVLGWREMECCA